MCSHSNHTQTEDNTEDVKKAQTIEPVKNNIWTAHYFFISSRRLSYKTGQLNQAKLQCCGTLTFNLQAPHSCSIYAA